MTLMTMCSILDRKAKSFGPPLLFQNLEIAQRMAKTMMTQRGDSTDLEKYPEDFDLYWIGEYDNETATIIATPVPKLILTFGDLI